MSNIKSISVSEEFNSLAQEHNLSWSEAARIGMAVMLGDRGIREYDNKLNLMRKMTAFRQTLEDTSLKLEEAEEKLKKIEGKN
jgi:hypothetical protein